MDAPSTRCQASLFLTDVPHIEAMRRRFNPDQEKLIAAHVTLCREDEVKDWSGLHERLMSISPFEITIEFGPPVRKGNLVFLPAIRGTDQFDKLRSALLTENSNQPRNHLPHVTVIHPRNGHCTDRAFEEITTKIPAFFVTFSTVSLIKQSFGGIWQPLVLPVTKRNVMPN